MKIKTLITVIPLAFVAVSIVYLVVKESTTKTDTPVAPQTNEQTPSTEPQSQPPPTNQAQTKDRKITVYYFHGNMRCMTCRKIEAYTKEVIGGYTEALKNGPLEWQVVNVDQPSNEHFVRDFQLTTRSVVIEETSDGKRTRWKNLDRVWKLTRDKNAFLKYIQDEIQTYLKGPDNE